MDIGSVRKGSCEGKKWMTIERCVSDEKME